MKFFCLYRTLTRHFVAKFNYFYLIYFEPHRLRIGRINHYSIRNHFEPHRFDTKIRLFSIFASRPFIYSHRYDHQRSFLYSSFYIHFYITPRALVSHIFIKSYTYQKTIKLNKFCYTYRSILVSSLVSRTMSLT